MPFQVQVFIVRISLIIIYIYCQRRMIIHRKKTVTMYINWQRTQVRAGQKKRPCRYILLKVLLSMVVPSRYRTFQPAFALTNNKLECYV